MGFWLINSIVFLVLMLMWINNTSVTYLGKRRPGFSISGCDTKIFFCYGLNGTYVTNCYVLWNTNIEDIFAEIASRYSVNEIWGVRLKKIMLASVKHSSFSFLYTLVILKTFLRVLNTAVEFLETLFLFWLYLSRYAKLTFFRTFPSSFASRVHVTIIMLAP